MKVNHRSTEREPAPKLLIKQVARRLFAARGIHDVSVREIAKAAEQRNLGVVAYYFGTKDQLVREILIDGAQRIETRRAGFLDRLEAAGGPSGIEQTVAAIVLPSARFADEDSVYGSFFNRFLQQISITSIDLIDGTLEGQGNRAYQRCLTHLRAQLAGLSPAEQNRRFLFLGTYVGALLAQRDMMVADTVRQHPTWRSDAFLEDIICTGAALLAAR